MKAYLTNMHLLVPRSRSSAKVKVKYKGYISQKMAVSGAFVFHKHILSQLYFKWVILVLFKTGAIIIFYRIQFSVESLQSQTNTAETKLRDIVLLYPITAQCCIVMHYRYIAVENIVRKGEIACNKQLLLFSQCFLPCMVLIFHFKCTLKCHLQFVWIWTSLKFCYLVIG